MSDQRGKLAETEYWSRVKPLTEHKEPFCSLKAQK